MSRCTLSNTAFDGKVYLITVANRSIPAAVFTCEHCAKLWLTANSPYGGIAELEIDSELFRKIVDAVADVQIFHNADNTATSGALHEHKFEV